MSNTITNEDDVIDSRDIIERIEELLSEMPEDDTAARQWDGWAELKVLEKLAAQANCSPDWHHGETLIRHDYFVEYIEQLILDCHEFPKEINQGKWPFNHMKMDWEAAAKEAEQDYMSVDFDGVEYLIRA